MMLTQLWTEPESDAENAAPKASPARTPRCQVLGSPMVDITNRPVGASPRVSPKKSPAPLLRRRPRSSSASCMAQEQQEAVERQALCLVVEPSIEVTLQMKPAVEEAGLCERQPSPAVGPKTLVAALSDPSPAVSRAAARAVLKDRAHAKQQAAEPVPCRTQLRDVLDVMLWAFVIFVVAAMAVVFYQLTVRGHTGRLLFARRQQFQYHPRISSVRGPRLT